MFQKLLYIVAVFLAALAGTNAFSQAYPSKPIRLIVPFPPGGSTDFFGRVTAQRLGQTLGEQVLVDNRGGAGGNIGTELAAKSPPDGYTLLLGHTGTLAINPALYAKVPYDPVRDFSPVSLVATTALVLVSHPSLPAKTVKDLISLARTRPGQINYATGGNGTGTHLSAELFKTMARVDITHVPYKGSGPAIVSVIAGETSILFTPIPAVVGHVKAGRLRAIGVTDVRRSDVLPNVLTIAEGGLPGYESTLKFGLLTPAGAATQIISTLNRAVVKSMGTSDARDQLAKEGAEPTVSTPEEFRTVILSEMKKWAAIVKSSGARVD